MNTPYQVMPPLSAEEFQELEDSILEKGVLVPVEYDEAGNILDGHNRVAICEKHGLCDWPKLIRKGLSEDEKRAHARELNLKRRHLTTAAKRALVEEQIRDTPSLSSRAIAARLGVDHKTVEGRRQAMASTGEIPQLEKTQGRDGRERRKPIPTMFLPEKANIPQLKQVAKQIRTAERRQSRAVRLDLVREIAEKGRGRTGRWRRGGYVIAYADPPWQQEAWSDETGQDKGLPYPHMPLDEIKAYCAGADSPAAESAVLLLWAPTNRLDDAIDVMRAWGFDYVTAITWDKVDIGMGRWVRDRTEHLLIGKRGPISLAPLMGSQAESLLTEKKGRHSAKPEAIALMIERLWPDLPKIELFCRTPRPGWDVDGFESGGEA